MDVINHDLGMAEIIIVGNLYMHETTDIVFTEDLPSLLMPITYSRKL